MIYLSPADTAKKIRLYLKSHGIKWKSVTSSMFANGSSVSIYVTPEVYGTKPVDFWRDISTRFSYSSSHYNLIDGFSPGVKYVSVHVRRP